MAIPCCLPAWTPRQRALAAGERFHCALFVSDFAHPPLRAPRVDWRLCDQQGRVYAEGAHDYPHQPYCTCPAGEIDITLPRGDSSR